MKPTLNEEIGMQQAGIDYVNSLEVKDPVHVNAKQMAEKSMRGSLDKFYQEKERERVLKESKKSWNMVIVLMIIFFMVLALSSCSFKQPIFKITAKNKSFYVKDGYIDFANDSVYFVEFNRNGSIRNNLALPSTEALITEIK